MTSALRALLLLAAAAVAAPPTEIPYRLANGFSAAVPADWLARESWRGEVPGVTFSWFGPEGEHRVLVYKYPSDNAYRISRQRFVSDLERRTPKAGKVRLRSGKKNYTVYRGLSAPPSSWSQPHFDPDEAVLGASGGDYSAKGRLLRCREKGAWHKYDWYREAYGDDEKTALFFKTFTAEDRRLVSACLGRDALSTIETLAAPDPAITEPDDAQLDEMAARLETAAPEPPEESVCVQPGRDGFFVFRYESPPGRQDRLYPAFLRLLQTFKPE